MAIFLEHGLQKFVVVVLGIFMQYLMAHQMLKKIEVKRIMSKFILHQDHHQAHHPLLIILILM